MSSTWVSRRRFVGALAALPSALLGVPEATQPSPHGDKEAAMNIPVTLKVTALQVSSILERHIQTGYMPGAVALIARGDQAEVIEIGQRSRERAGHMRRNSIFRIASMTKPLTAAAAMMLVERKLLHLDEPIARWLPELAHLRVLRSLDGALSETVPAKRPINLEDLLTFRCGWGVLLAPPGTYPIQRQINELKLLGFGPPDPSNPLHPQEWLKRLGTLPLMAQPGDEWLYNTGSYILGVLLSRAVQRPLPDLLRGLIFEPLKMTDTGFYVPEPARERLVSAYRLEAGRAQIYDAADTSLWNSPPAFPDGGAGLVSTADDFFAFARLLLGGGRAGGVRLLSDASIAAMTRDHLTATQRERGAAILGRGRGWGFGIAVVTEPTDIRLPPGAYGWNGGLGTSWLSDPATGLTGILLTQTMFSSPSAPAVHQEFQRALFAPAVT